MKLRRLFRKKKKKPMEYDWSMDTTGGNDYYYVYWDNNDTAEYN